MNFQPLLSSVPPIPSHAIAALAALAVGTAQLLRAKGTVSHRWTGRIWVVLMAYVAASGFFISEFKSFGYFSVIHLLSLFTLGSLVWAVWAARTGRIAVHKRAMTIMFFLALVLTGLFTLYPGRTMHQVVFGA